MEMSPTSRNTLMIGGALILISLLLVCGPLTDRFGSGGSGVDTAPTVSAGPPADDSGAVEAASAGALIGASIAEIDVAALDDTKPGGELMGLGEVGADAENGAEAALAAAAVTGVAAGAIAASESGSGGGRDEKLPAVSAGVPAVAVAAPVVAGLGALAADGGENTVEAPRAFDNSLASLSPLGPAKNLFAPPVAAESGGSPQPFGIDNASMPRVCDSAGSGCNSLNPVSIGGVGGGVTPFKPGNPRGTP
jgi:hypothetical protein